MTISISRSMLFRFFLAWVFFSAFYYAPYLIDGRLMADSRSEDFLHKALKYFVAILLSTAYVYLYRSKNLIFHEIVLISVLILLFLMMLEGYSVGFGLQSIIVFMAFIGFAHYASRFDLNQIFSLEKVILYSSLLVSLISYMEYQLFEAVLGSYWRYTGGFRSVSTLLNPNNLGIYLGAALVLLAFGGSLGTRQRIGLGIVVFGAFYMTGSRTAWLALFLSLVVGVIYRGRGMLSLKYLLVVARVFVAAILIVPFLLIGNFLALPERVTDMHTANLRLEKYFSYISGFNWTYILPDLYGERVEMVSESGYFHLLNSIGLFWAFLFIMLMGYSFSSGWFKRLFEYHPARGFDVLLLYYFVAMFFENVMMSFPNNQLFIIALGVSVAAWKARESGKFMNIS